MKTKILVVVGVLVLTAWIVYAITSSNPSEKHELVIQGTTITVIETVPDVFFLNREEFKKLEALSDVGRKEVVLEAR